MAERTPEPVLSLFAGMDQEQKEHFKSAYIGSKILLDATLRKVIQTKLQESLSSVEKASVYELPNAFAYLSDQAGYRRALNEILKLLP